MNWSLPRVIFVLLAPITVPLYLLYLAYVNLAGLSLFVLGEMTLARLFGRTAPLPPLLFWILSPLIIVAAAPLLAAHLAIWCVKVLLGGLIAIGRWQTGLAGRAISLILGGAWTALFLWCMTVSIDADLAMKLIGREVTGASDYSVAARRHTTLGDLPPAMQQRRIALRDSFINGENRNVPDAAYHAEMLNDDQLDFGSERSVHDRPSLPYQFRTRLAGIPWYYVPADVSPDGTSFSRFLVGPLLLTLILMIRWPGVSPRYRSTALRLISFIIRVSATVAIFWLTLTWTRSEFVPRDESPPGQLEAALSPLTWCFHQQRFEWFPPQWVTLNVACWLVMLTLAAAIWRLAIRVRTSITTPRFYSAFLAARLLQRKRIAFFSVGAVTLCVAMLLIVISVMGGFVDTIRARASGLLGDLVMDGDLRGFPFYDEFLKEIRQWPEVQQATALIYSYGTLRFEKGETFPVQIWGVNLDEYVQVNSFGRDLWYNQRYPGTTVLSPIAQPLYGYNLATSKPVLPEPYEAALDQWLSKQPVEVQEQYARVPSGYFPGPGVYGTTTDPDFKPMLKDPERPGIIIGRDILFRRLPSGEYQRSERFPRGCRCALTMLPLSRTGALITESPPTPAFRYIDDSRTGIYDIDKKNVYVDFKVLQEKLSMDAAQRADGSGTAPPRCSQIQVKLKPGQDLLEMKARVANAWRNALRHRPGDADDFEMAYSVQVMTWEELQREYIAAIQKEKVLVVIMFSVISLVAVFLVLCIFYMIVIEKTRDIGIIKSVGGSAEGVAAIFLTYGAAIGIVGGVLGSIIGYLFVRHINDVQDWLARLNPAWRVWSPETYSFDKIPDSVQTSDMILIAIAAVIASVLGAVIPAIRASRTWPVEALRYE